MSWFGRGNQAGDVENESGVQGSQEENVAGHMDGMVSADFHAAEIQSMAAERDQALEKQLCAEADARTYGADMKNMMREHSKFVSSLPELQQVAKMKPLNQDGKTRATAIKCHQDTYEKTGINHVTAVKQLTDAGKFVYVLGPLAEKPYYVPDINTKKKSTLLVKIHSVYAGKTIADVVSNGLYYGVFCNSDTRDDHLALMDAEPGNDIVLLLNRVAKNTAGRNKMENYEQQLARHTLVKALWVDGPHGAGKMVRGWIPDAYSVLQAEEEAWLMETIQTQLVEGAPKAEQAYVAFEAVFPNTITKVGFRQVWAHCASLIGKADMLPSKKKRKLVAPIEEIDIFG